MLNLEIDGKKLQVEPGSMVIEAADAAGIYIPRFCYHKKLSVAANCRMCLVDVEKVAKPLPACATPVTEGMRVFTQSGKTKEAQRGVMEFLLINHPLDCPICDQGGECDLQDLAVGYGRDISRYAEDKRAVKDKDLGPLIATEMTRCIHCTRCVRFGQEIAGLMELGATGRGEHMEIGTYVEQSVDSELSGNMIDLCPVGALTSKPFRYTGRPWELKTAPSVSPHDCVGSNLRIQTRANKVLRVLPRENEEINEVWLSDRDRFSYEALHSPERLTVPKIKLDGEWQATDWATALEFTAAGLRKAIERHGAEQLGALAAPNATVEEFYLLQKLLRSLGSDNIDHRLRQRDFTLDQDAPLFPWLGQTIHDLEDLDAALLIASNIRKEEPILSLRLRKAFLGGAKLMAVNATDDPFIFGLSAKTIVSPLAMLPALARIARHLGAKTGKSLPKLPAWAMQGEASAAEQAIAETLAAGGKSTVLLGSFAGMHPRYGDLRLLAELIAELSGASFGELCQANGAGAWVAGCVPHRGPAGVDRPKPGRHAYSMVETPLKAYLLWGVEPELDMWDGGRSRAAMAQAEFVVSCSLFETAADYAHVQLPLAAFAETEGTFVNCEGRAQSFAATIKPSGEARPGWKILRVLGNLLKLPGFEYVTAHEVRAEIPKQDRAASKRAHVSDAPIAIQGKSEKLVRVGTVPPYGVDSLVRRAPPLLKTRDNPPPAAHINPAQAQALGLAHAKRLRLRMDGAEAVLPLALDPRIPDGCVWVPAGYPETAPLPAYGELTLAQVT